MNDPSNITRRLAAIVFADIAGFSRLMAVDEAQTLRRWKSLRTEVMEPYTAQEGGRIVEMAGDALLVEFRSAVNAVRWATDVQRAAESRLDASDDFSISLRIGVNIEDAIDDEGVLQGDGVNVAARIHQAAAPGQIVVTSIVRDFVINRLPVTFHDLGSPPMKNIARPVHVFAVSWADDERPQIAFQPYLQWSTRPTIAVLPFRNIGDNPDDDYFGEGITEDIITGLSHSRSFFVIARTSTLRYRDRGRDLRQIAGELDVRYVLDGSVRRRKGGLRINAELIDAAANRPVWANRFDGTSDDLFEFQDEIVASIVGSLEPRVRAIEVSRVRGRPTHSMDAYDCVLMALSRLYDFTDESYRHSGEALERAIALDASYGQAFAYSAWRLNFLVGEGRSSQPDLDRALAIEHASRAVELDPEDAFALTVSAHIISFFEQKPDEAIDLFHRALLLNENSAFGWGMSALTYAYTGRPDDALDRLRNVWRLSPFDPLNFYFWIVAGISEFVAGRYPEAIAWLRKSRRANPRFVACLRILVASLVHAGDLESARAIAAELLDADPDFRIGTFVRWYPLRRRQDLERLAEGLRAAGLPE